MTRVYSNLTKVLCSNSASGTMLKLLGEFIAHLDLIKLERLVFACARRISYLKNKNKSVIVIDLIISFFFYLFICHLIQLQANHFNHDSLM